MRRLSFGNVNINFNNGTVAQTIQGLPGSGTPSNIGAFLGQRSCLPQFQGQVIYEKDLYGKAGWKDKAKAFTAEVEAAFQHTQYLSGNLGTPCDFWQWKLSAPERQQLRSEEHPDHDSLDRAGHPVHPGAGHP